MRIGELEAESAALFGDSPLLLIGATALEIAGCLDHRATEDLDFLVALDPNALAARLEGRPGWVRGEKAPRWHFGNVELDLIPASSELLAAGEVELQRGVRLDLTGARRAFERSRPLHPGVRIADPLSVILLKMVAFLDRPADRRRDLGDLLSVLSNLVTADDDRLFSDDVLARSLFSERASAFLAGQELALDASATERLRVGAFIERLLHPTKTHDLHLMAREARGIGDVEKTTCVLRAFADGFGV